MSRDMKTARPLLVLTFLGLSTSALADSSSATMQVSVEVVSGCSISAAPMRFAGDAGARALAEAELALSCTPGTAFEVALDGGEHARGGLRRMRSAVADAFLDYQIFSDPARRERWGSQRGFDTVGGSAGSDGRVQLTAYGAMRSPAVSTAPGHYSDTIVVTVDF